MRIIMSRGNFVIKILMIFKFLNSSSIQVPPKLQRCQLWYVLGSDELRAISAQCSYSS